MVIKKDVIPIATQQAKDWYKDATKDELDELKHKHITQHQKINLQIQN